MMKNDNVTNTTGKELLLRYANQNSLYESCQKQGPRSGIQERKPYRNSSHTVRAFEALQLLREDAVLCDIELKADDGIIVYGHRVVLASCSPCFHEMFTTFKKNIKDHVIINGLDSTTLYILVDFIYTGQIMVTEENVIDLLFAANIIQLQDVQDACCDFLQTQLHPINVRSIKTFTDLHGCIELFSSSESYIQQHFLEVVESEQFLSLTSDQVIKLISCDKLTVSSKEKVFECVIRWINHESSFRKDILPKLMEYVNFPLVPKEYLLKKVEEGYFRKNSLDYKDYIIEALHFHLLKSEQLGIIPKTIRNTPRQPVGLSKIILVVGGETFGTDSSIEWYDPAINRWKSMPDMTTRRCSFGLAVLKDCRVFAVGGYNGLAKVRTVEMLDLSSPSPCWVPTVPMLSCRKRFGIAVLDGCVYAVGGSKTSRSSAEVFNSSTQIWQMISNMSTERINFGVGVLNNVLYAVGGYDRLSKKYLKSVECYNPRTNTWTPIAEMNDCRKGAGVGILYGVMYAVGGCNKYGVQNSVEAYTPSSGVWTSIANMRSYRRNAGVIALDGLLYVMGGKNGASNLSSVEVYNPNTMIWNLLTIPMNIGRSGAGVVVIDKFPYFGN